MSDDDEEFCWYCGNDFRKDGLCTPCAEQDRERREESRYSLMSDDD